MPETTTQTVEGVSEQEKPESQETPVTSQEAQETQDQSVEKVESTQTTKPSDGERRRPREFYEARERHKKRIETLEQTVANLQDRVESQKPKPDPPKKQPVTFDTDKFLANPQEVLDQLFSEERKAIKEELRQEILETELPNAISQTNQKQEMIRKQQGALEMIFPRSGPEDNRTLDQRVEAEPEKMRKMDELWVEHGLQYVWANDPQRAIATLSKLLKGETKKNPNVIPKSQTGSTATGSPTSGGKKMPTLTEIKSQLDVLDKEVDENPEIRYDDGWNEKRTKLVDALTALAVEQRKAQ